MTLGELRALTAGLADHTPVFVQFQTTEICDPDICEHGDELVITVSKSINIQEIEAKCARIVLLRGQSVLIEAEP